MRRLIVATCCFFVLVFSHICFAEVTDVRITASPSSDAIKTKVNIQNRQGPISYIDIVITNTGSEKVVLQDIAITLKPDRKIENDDEIIFGGTCMGRTPLQRFKVSDEDLADSAMLAMIKHDKKAYSFVGAISWRMFMPYISYENGTILIKSDAERKSVNPGQSIHYEKIMVARGDYWQDILDAYGDSIAKENGIKKVKDVDFKGWATWDYYGRLYGNDDINGNIDALKKMRAGANMIQIDGGWWTERGDYTSPRPDLKGGMKAVADDIRAAGYIPAIHIDGFRADLASQVAKEHPEYFLTDENGKMIVDTMQKVDREMNYIFFDYSHPGALAHIRKCIRTIKNDWGYRYFKVDFMRCGIEQSVKYKRDRDILRFKEVNGHVKGITSIERFRMGMKAIREAIGDDCYFLGCSAVFGPCIGFVDGMRTGGDISPVFEFYKTRCLMNAGNYYLHNKVFSGDADYIVLRNKDDEGDNVFKSSHKHGGTVTDNEIRMWVDFCIMYGSIKLESDNLMTLRDERKDLFKAACAQEPMDTVVPLDLWDSADGPDDAFSILIAKRRSEIFIAVFNWDDSGRSFNISGLDKTATLSPIDENSKTLKAKNGKATVQLKARTSVIYKYKGKKSFDVLLKQLSI